MDQYKGKTYAIGDIHGSNKALLQCIERSDIDKEKDTLIVLGDVVDGWFSCFKIL
jgi:serine/threonine protein phosphatase 1